ncbi:MAG: DUF3857 and transglutaminase domain-containing protein [Acetobacteraceae bacterium]|nr:DUF3857 and transglutaminase domain-containing protein [Acetobacteraceae bacterium]
MRRFVLVLLMCLVFSGRAWADPAPLRRDVWTVFIHLNRDFTYTETIEQEYTFLDSTGIPLADRDDVAFYPKSQSLDLVEAYVIEPDGTRIDVPAGARFTRPSEQAQDTPGFTSSETTTVLFPQLREGSRTHVIWRLTQTTPSVLGFNMAVHPLLEWPTKHMRVTIDAPADMPLRWAERGGFSVSDTTVGGRRTIAVRIDDQPGEEPEQAMVSSSDFLPMFVATTLRSTEELGAIYHRQAAGKAAVTPEIATTAARIVGDRTGLTAAAAIHDWVAANIRYVALYLDPNDGWVPHRAAEVLASGYGDCKDHVVLFQALLAARDIRAEPALVNWGRRYGSFPLGVPQQFNHVIAWLPEFGLFANPTNPYARLGALDRKLSGKPIVIATAQGLVARTPRSRPEENRYSMTSTLTLGADGEITGQSRFTMDAAIETSAREDVATAASTRELAERMLAATPEGGFGDLDASDPKDLATPFSVEANWSSPHGVAFRDGEAYFSTPVGVDFEQAGTLLRPYLSDPARRRRPVQVGAMALEWHYSISLPQGYAAVRLPKDVRFANDAGSYVAHYERAGAVIEATRRLVVDRDVYEAAEYEDLQHLFFTALDDVRAVFVTSRMQAQK